MNDFTCKICGQQVSKRKSYAYADGRACKIHQEAQETNQGRIDDKKAKDDAAEEARKAKEERRNKPRDWRATATVMHQGCWKCRKQGITLHQYYLNMLVGLERENLKGEFNFFANPSRTAELGGTNKDTLVIIPYTLTRSCRLDHETYMWTQMSGNTVQLCQNCAKEAGYDPAAREKELTDRNNLTLEQLSLMSSVYERSELHETVKMAAKIKEICERVDDAAAEEAGE
jgi:hypothetical protein